MKFDEKDLMILDILQRDANTSNKEISDQINLSMTPVYERVKKLISMSMLKKKVYLLDRRKLDLNVMVLVSISMEKHSNESALTFMEEIQKIPEVVECFHVTGAFDYQLKVMVRDVDHYHEFNFKKLSTIKGIRHMESYFVMKEIVNTTQVPLFI
ncbi:Lrp/AsnC family transcriptional regulator [Sphingobacterium shayense]|uniref:Lrp/AsnC family transcriptional regulator n=1 Tax=Sphingobacterium shayense TaxID=626343 RepID=UPI00155813DB|nr:Lrp/AsnC family transcriptional regulator [Sphingobacterium shayense]NQD72469.1 Lrp/AsnC family transcriptional regulator [Sphingobacterium shayense]